MEENKRFRNHISIVVERLGAGFWLVMTLLVMEFMGEAETLINDMQDLEVTLFAILIAAGGILLLVGLLLAWQIYIWSRTYISVQENTIVLEKNTLNRQKNTIGLQNISNVNLEQNLFEMLVGTCKVKLDTNSLSTANSTDVKIVLKKHDAEAFRKLILSMINQEDAAEEAVFQDLQHAEESTPVGRIVEHGLFAMHISTLIMAIVCITFLVVMIVDVANGSGLGQGIAGILSSILVLVMFAWSAIWDIAKGFVQYYGFSVKRAEDKLYIRYGLLKKVNYTIPIDKINGVKFVQTTQARLAGRCMAELINVGMGDEAKHEQSFFLLYDKKEKIEAEVERLLPEFAGCLEKEAVRQPKEVWILKLIPILLYTACATSIVLMGGYIWGIRTGLFVGAAAIALSLFFLLNMILSFKVCGSSIDEDYLQIVRGCYGKQILFVKYEKIQYVELKQNFLAKHFHMQKAQIHLLASARNKDHVIPYFAEEQAEKLKLELLD